MTIDEKLNKILEKPFEVVGFLFFDLPKKISEWYADNLAKFPLDISHSIGDKETQPSPHYINFAKAYNAGEIKDGDIIIANNEAYKIKRREGLRRWGRGSSTSFWPGVEVQQCNNNQTDRFYWNNFPEWKPAYLFRF